MCFCTWLSLNSAQGIILIFYARFKVAGMEWRVPGPDASVENAADAESGKIDDVKGGIYRHTQNCSSGQPIQGAP